MIQKPIIVMFQVAICEKSRNTTNNNPLLYQILSGENNLQGNAN